MKAHPHAKAGNWVWMAVAVLMLVQAAQVAYIVHRESLTFDEADHIFAGYQMWKTGDYGLNPEHPPLVKLLATSVILSEKLTVPPLQGRFFKLEAYFDGRDFLAANDPDHHLVFRMRLVAELLALGMSLAIFLAALEWFGSWAALIALTVAVFDPNLLAHSALVTTDMGLCCFLLLSLLAFYRWASRPTMLRLLLAGLAAGCLIGVKHSGILLAPMLIALAIVELALTERGNRIATARRLFAGLAVIVLIAVTILWSLYGFRYAARPPGLALSVTLADYMAPLSAPVQAIVSTFARFHLLPESYLFGLVDVKIVAQGSPTYILDKVYPHGVWWYFPLAILIKTTLGLMLLVALAFLAIAIGKLKRGREALYVVLPGFIYLLFAVTSGLNIGARHVLPLYALGAILAGGGAWALISSNRRWAVAVIPLVLWHIGSSLAVFPVGMAYANEAWGGPSQIYRHLSDANVDWAQQLLQVKAWEDKHPGEECWFAYFAEPVIEPASYGIRCHILPSSGTLFAGGGEITPAVIHGAVLISAGELSGCLWPSAQLNPFLKFQSLHEGEQIDHGVMVYQGDFSVPELAALSLVSHSQQLLQAGTPESLHTALDEARKAAALLPQNILTQTMLGDVAQKLGRTAEARGAYQAAVTNAQRLEPDAQPSYLPDLQAKLAKL